MLKLFTLAALTLAAQDSPKAAQPAPPKPIPLTEVEALRLENLQIRYEALIREICSAKGLSPACIVDPRVGAYDRPAPQPPAQPKQEAKK